MSTKVLPVLPSAALLVIKPPDRAPHTEERNNGCAGEEGALARRQHVSHEADYGDEALL